MQEPPETRTAVAAARSDLAGPTAASDSLAWMRLDLAIRLVPFTALVAAIWAALRPAWLGLGPGSAPAQLAFGLGGGALFFAAACALQGRLAPGRGLLRVPGSAAGPGV